MSESHPTLRNHISSHVNVFNLIKWRRVKLNWYYLSYYVSLNSFQQIIEKSTFLSLRFQSILGDSDHLVTEITKLKL
jgi:hypothetical protein